jgi:hypothetical protein
MRAFLSRSRSSVPWVDPHTDTAAAVQDAGMTTTHRGRDTLGLAQLDAPQREQAMARSAVLRPHLDRPSRYPRQRFRGPFPMPTWPRLRRPPNTARHITQLTTATPSVTGTPLQLDVLRDGRHAGHYPDYASGISQPPSTHSLTTCDLMSQATR